MRSIQFTRPLVSADSCCRNEIRNLTFFWKLDAQLPFAAAIQPIVD